MEDVYLFENDVNHFEQSNGDPDTDDESNNCYDIHNNNGENENNDYDEAREPMEAEYYNFDDRDHLRIERYIECTAADILLMTEAYRIRNNINWSALGDLLLLINSILGTNALPSSVYLYRKKICSSNLKRVIHFTCEKCNVYLGTRDELKESNQSHCRLCETEITRKTKYKKNFFVTLPIESQIKRMVEENIEHFEMCDSEHSDSVADFRDGMTYKQVKETLNGTDFISLTFNTDGGQVFKKCKEASLWPVQFFINEFKLNVRFKRDKMICAAFSYGGTPEMTVLLRPFIEEINKINANGGLDIEMKDKTTRRFLIVPLYCCLDSVAKCHVLNSVQFNGFYGCPICQIKGVSVGKVVRYIYTEVPPLRTNIESRREMRLANDTGMIVKGYKGLSVLQAIRVVDFDMVWQLPPDVMHIVELGVTKKMMNLWLSGVMKEK